MLYLSKMLHTTDTIDIGEFIGFWENLGQKIEVISPLWKIWKIWNITQIYYGDDIQRQIYTMKEEWEPISMEAVALASPCYLHAEGDSDGTTVTILASEEAVLAKVNSFIESLCPSMQETTLENFLRSFDPFLVIAMKRHNDEDGYQQVQVFDKPTLISLLNSWPKAEKLLSFSALIERSEPVSTYMVDVDNAARRIGFAVKASSEEDEELLKRLFQLVEKLYKGEW